MSSGSFRNVLITVRTKKGSQHMVKALMMMPRVVLAFRSLASWSRSRFCLWGELTSLLVLLVGFRAQLFVWRGEVLPEDCRYVAGGTIDVVIEAGTKIGCFSAHGCSIGHWDSLLLRGPPAKHFTACTLHCKQTRRSKFYLSGSNQFYT